VRRAPCPEAYPRDQFTAEAHRLRGANPARGERLRHGPARGTGTVRPWRAGRRVRQALAVPDGDQPAEGADRHGVNHSLVCRTHDRNTSPGLLSGRRRRTGGWGGRPPRPLLEYAGRPLVEHTAAPRSEGRRACGARTTWLLGAAADDVRRRARLDGYAVNRQSGLAGGHGLVPCAPGAGRHFAGTGGARAVVVAPGGPAGRRAPRRSPGWWPRTDLVRAWWAASYGGQARPTRCCSGAEHWPGVVGECHRRPGGHAPT